MYKKSTQEELKERREKIICLLADNDKKMLNKDLAKILQVSNMTVRRDLEKLENAGLVTRFHGGVRLNDQISNRCSKNSEIYIEGIKSEIARRAADFVPEMATVFINSSTTAALAVQFFKDKQLTIVSNNILLGQENVNPSSTILLTGGEIRSHKEALVGDLAIDAIIDIQANVSIIGCSGVSANQGVSTNNVHESKVNSLMIENTTDHVIVVADHRKIGKDTNFKVTDLENIDLLITDSYSDNKIIREIEDLGVQVIQIDFA